MLPVLVLRLIGAYHVEVDSSERTLRNFRVALEIGARARELWKPEEADRPLRPRQHAFVEQLDPGSAKWHLYQGEALLSKGEIEAALKAIQQEPDELSRLASLVMAYHALGQAVESNAALADELTGHLARTTFEDVDELAFGAPPPILADYPNCNAVSIEQRPHLASRQVDIVRITVIPDHEAETIAMPANLASHEIQLGRQAKLTATVLENLPAADHRIQPVDEERSHPLAFQTERIEDCIRFKGLALLGQEIDQLVRTGNRVLVGLALLRLFVFLRLARQVIELRNMCELSIDRRP